jgi:hypothetical protein
MARSDTERRQILLRTRRGARVHKGKYMIIRSNEVA